MKKLLVLLVVLGLVSTASAVVLPTVDIQISSLNGTTIAPVSEITLKPSDTIVLDITFDASADFWMFGLGAQFNGVHDATLDISKGVRNSLFDVAFDVRGADFISEVANMTLVPGLGPQGAGVGTKVIAVSGITLHCDAASPDLAIVLTNYLQLPTAVINATMDPQTFAFGPGVLIHQVPEPMTLMLLGLGSLFLARRKK